MDTSVQIGNNRILNRLVGVADILGFGDYILFQEYEQDKIDGHYRVSKPILAIYLGGFVYDMALGFNYVRWNNDRHLEYVNDGGLKHPVCKEVVGVEKYIEWSNTIDILGHWKNKPNWREILKSYRMRNVKEIIRIGEIE